MIKAAIEQACGRSIRMAKHPWTLLAFLVVASTTRSLGDSPDSYTRPRDFSAWYWIQVEKGTFKDQYFSVQCQVRYDNNATTFDRTNLYFSYGYDWTKNFSIEALYQLNFNYEADQRTFYFGGTRKFRINSRWSLYLRSAFQHTRNHFTGDYRIDQPITEWRNRLRLTYKFDIRYSLALSAEPYLVHDGVNSIYLSRIRYLGQFSTRLNKYNSITLFYLLQPDVADYGVNGTSHVAGVTYSLKLPDKAKNYPHFFSGRNRKKNQNNEGDKDTFN